MRKLLVFVVVAVAAWYGWHHLGDLNSVPRDEAVVENQSGRVMNRVRLTVGGETYVRDTIKDGELAKFPFVVKGDGTFQMAWTFEGDGFDKTWSGGEVSAGPMRTRHHIQVAGDGGVVWSSEHFVGKKS